MRIRVVQYCDKKTREPTDFYYYEVSEGRSVYNNRCLTEREVLNQLSLDLKDFLRRNAHLNMEVK